MNFEGGIMKKSAVVLLAVMAVFGSACSGIDAAMAASVKIVVMADTGGPVAGVQAQIATDTSSYSPGKGFNRGVSVPKGNGVTNSEGMIVFNVPDGRYAVVINYLGESFTKSAQASASQSQPLQFVVPKSKVVEQPFFISNRKSEAIAGAKITIIQDNKAVTTATANNEGFASIPLIAGKYKAQVVAQGKTVTQEFSVSKRGPMVQVDIDGTGAKRPGQIKALGR
jgi:hypothetical protein